MEEKNCPVYKKCSGCALRNMTYDETLRFKKNQVVRLMGKLGRVENVIGMSAPDHYRNKVSMGFRVRRGGIVSGVYQSATGNVIAVDNCLLDAEIADRIVKAVREIALSMKIPVYNEYTGRGFLKHVMVRTGFKTGEVMVVVVSANNIFPAKNNFVSELTRRFPEIVSIVLNVNKNPDKMLLSRDETVLFGKNHIEDILCGKKFRISSKSFFQVNPVQTEVLYDTAIKLAGIGKNDVVLDAYSGIGTISIIAADKAKQVYGVEINRAAVEDAKVNAMLNNTDNVDFICADAGKFLAEMKERKVRCRAAFLDPARAGCDKRFLSALASLSPERIVYISCNPETEARDVFFLLQNGYAVKKIVPVDMFPFTSHVECIVLLTKPDRP